MAKYIKSLFTPERRRNAYGEELEGETESPPLDDRRKLSMSRSGRLKQSYKKRQQLNVEVYAGQNLHAAEKPKAMEYHVNKPVTPKQIAKQPKTDSQNSSIESKIESTENDKSICTEINNGSKSPEEEIDSAFEIIDKS